MSITRATANAAFIAWLSLSFYILLKTIESLITKSFTEFITITSFATRYVNYIQILINMLNKSQLLISSKVILMSITLILACILISLSSETLSEVLLQAIIYNAIFIAISIYNDMSMFVSSFSNFNEIIRYATKIFLEKYLSTLVLGVIIILLISIVLRFLLLRGGT
ncbi:MAG: hypothetical protein ACTSVA_04470 [Candidatus Njordarchaeales archaeon]